MIIDPAVNAVSNVIMTQFTSSALVVWLMQKLKNASWFPWLSHGRASLSRTVSVISAFLIAVGINYSWNPQTRGLLFTIPPVSVILLGIWHWANQFALNETIYQATVNKLSITTTPEGSTATPKVTSDGAVVIPAK